MVEKTQLQFVQLRTMKVMDTSISHFAIQSYGNNMIIQNPGVNTVLLNCINEPDFVEHFPYIASRVELPDVHPLTPLLKDVDLRKIYTESNVLQQQEMGLDPILVVESSQEPLKPQVLQAHFSPGSNNKLVIVTTYGACIILQKNIDTNQWNEQVGNLTEMLITKVFPKSPAEISCFLDLKSFVDMYVCTACAWHDTGEFIFVANAASYLIVFKIESSSITFYCQEKVDMKRICCLKSFDDFLIVVSIDGIIKLYRFYRGNTSKLSAQIVYQETLWKYADQLSCSQLVLQKCQSTLLYSILCAKAAFVISFLLSPEGKLLGSERVRLPGIKVTGIAHFNENDYIVTTMTGRVFCLHFSYNYQNDGILTLQMQSDPVELKQIDTEVDELRGVSTTKNKSLWFFMLHSSKHEVSRQSGTFSTLSVCKLNTFDPLQTLSNLKYDIIDPYLDIILTVRMDAWVSKDGSKYDQYMPLDENTVLPTNINHEFLQKLRIRLEIAKVNFRRSNFKLQTVNEVFLSELEFLDLAVQISQILMRLQYLQQKDFLSPFQQKSRYFMHKAFNIFLEKLKNSFTDKNNVKSRHKIKELVLKFVELASRNFSARFQHEFMPAKFDFEDFCFFCNEPLGDQYLNCLKGHTLTRCCVSFVQIPNFCQFQCTQCGVMAYKDESNPNLLAELFPPDETVKCPLCCSMFVDA